MASLGRACAAAIRPRRSGVSASSTSSCTINARRRAGHRRALVQTRSRSTRTSEKEKKTAISRAISSNKEPAEAVEGIFGLRPVDYSVVPPIRHSPPPPPPFSKPGIQKYLFPLTLVFTAGTVAYFYVNNQNDNYEYWKAMQSGEALQMDDDDDDDEEYDDEEDEDEEE